MQGKRANKRDGKRLWMPLYNNTVMIAKYFNTNEKGGWVVACNC